MGLINPTYNNRIRYTLKHKEFGSLIITEPIGWRDDEKEYARNEKYHGVFAKFSNNLKFIDDGAEYISLIRNVYGINADIRLTRDEKHPHSDKWVSSYVGYLDLSTFELENKQVSVKFNEGGLQSLLKSRESEKIEIERTETIDGISLPVLKTDLVSIDGRRIFLKSVFNVEASNNNARMYNQTNGQTRGNTVGIPLYLKDKSHENAQSVIPNTTFGDNSHDRSGNANSGVMFLNSSDKDRRLKIKFNLSFLLKILNYNDLNWSKFWVRLAVYKNGSSFNHKKEYLIFYKDNHNIQAYKNRTLSFNFEQIIDIETGDSLSLQFCQLMDGRNGHSAHLDIDCQNIVCDLIIEEDSHFEKSNIKTILAHDLGNRLTQIITNRNDAFYSDILGRTDLNYNTDGAASLIGFSHGHWVRGFDKLPLDEKNKYKGFTTSFKDYMENLSVIWNLGLGIEKIGYKERIRIEKLEYFYNKNVTIKLPNTVKKLKRSEASDLYYSGLAFGYSKGGEYEEAMGLDEYNAKSTFTTVINRVKGVYNRISKYRADCYGMEFARRKPKSEHPTEDTKYDNDIFILDLKRYLNSFKQRLWQDDFEKKPTNVFSPETATNLRLTPFNIMLRHGWLIASGLTKYLSQYVRYGSSTANSKLSTKLKGSNEYAENSNILNSELKRPRFVNEWIEFEHAVNFEIMQQVEGSTMILGKKIPNFYGLVQFINENNEKEKGYLFNLKPNGSGKWKLLKANR